MLLSFIETKLKSSEKSNESSFNSNTDNFENSTFEKLDFGMHLFGRTNPAGTNGNNPLSPV